MQITLKLLAQIIQRTLFNITAIKNGLICTQRVILTFTRLLGF